MKQETSNPGQSPFTPPVSVFTGPIAELVGSRLLSPPTRPGLLASLARYEVLRVLGGGGMGVVVLARDSENGHDVAIKLIKPELVSEQRMVHRFIKEAGHLQKLKHPNVVPVLEVSDRAEGPYFVMPYFEKGSLAGRIRPGQPLESDVIVEIALQIAEGLAFAHRHGIIHRDLKPANILLGADNKSCLADFGLARTMFNDTLIDVARDQLEGTAPYMSPGVAAGNAEDTRCDIYAFGALLYEMLTGEPPYAGSNTHEIRSQILAGPPRRIVDRNPSADAGLITIAEGAMARELRDRYADMKDVVADLEKVKIGKPPVGARGLAGLVKQKSFSMWIPAGLLMIGTGLWLMWPSSPPEQPAVKLPSVVNPAPVPEPPPAPKPAPVPTVKSLWQITLLAGPTAHLKSPEGITVDTAGNVYVSDTGNNAIRKIASDGTVSTLAGLPGKSGCLDGSGQTARFMAPLGIATDAHGNVFVAEFASDLIRKISADGDVTTLAGSAGNPGSQNGAGDDAHFRNPWSVAVDNYGNVYVADKDNFTIREIDPRGEVSNFAGKPGVPGNSDGQGKYATFNAPHGIAVGPNGNIYVADTGNNAIRWITPSGLVSTLAKKFHFSDVQSLATDSATNVFVLDGNSIRKIDSKGVVTSLPDILLTDGGPRSLQPTSIAVDKSGNLYLAEVTKNSIWKVTPSAQNP